MNLRSFQLTVNPTVILQIARAKRHGIVLLLQAYNAAKKAGLDYALACAILMRETSGGHNVFGGDPTIFIHAGIVTKAKYLVYKKLRMRTGKAQGVGPCQLTSPGLQDSADRRGGCWVPYNNMLTGFSYLQGLIKQHGGMRDGIRAYNGSGPAAEKYSDAVMEARRNWQRILSGKAGALN